MAIWICILPIISAVIAAPFSVPVARFVAIGGVTAQALTLLYCFVGAVPLAGSYTFFPFGPVQLEITPSATLFMGSTIASSLFGMWLGWRQELEGRVFFQHILVINAAVMALVMTQKLLAIPFFWELTAIPLAVGIALWGKKDAARAASVFIGYQLFFGLLIGSALSGVDSVTSQLFGIPVENLPRPAAPLEPWITWVVTIGLVGKMGIFPFHGWIPATFRSVHPAGAILLVGSVMAGTLAMALRFQPMLNKDLFTILGVASYVYCSLLAFRVDNFRALISTILCAQLGLAAVALVNSTSAYVLLVTQILIVFSVLAALVGIIENRRGESTISSATGLARTTPRLGAFLILFLTATLPLPLLPGFPGTFLLLNSGIPTWLPPVIALTLLVQMTLVIKVSENLFKRSLPKGVREVKELRLREWWALIPATFSILLLGAFSARVLAFLSPVAAQ